MAGFDFRRMIVGIKGAGEMATGVAIRLKRSGFSRIMMMERENPLAVRRTVSFCEVIYEGITIVEGVEAALAVNEEDLAKVWQAGRVAVVVDPRWHYLTRVRPQVVIDAIIAKKNLGTTLTDAPLVIGLGPGFTAPVDVHRVIETMRGHDLGRVLEQGSAWCDTGIPGSVGGYTVERVLRSPGHGIFHCRVKIGEQVRAGTCVGDVDGREVITPIDGVVRGLIREGTRVGENLKIGDIDPRGNVDYCLTVSDKSRAIGGAVLEAIFGASSILEKGASA